MPIANGRQHARVDLALPAKLRADGQGPRYLAGETRNVSAGGALLSVHAPTPLHAGQRVRVGVATTRRQALLHAGDFIAATVLRTARLGGTQLVAVNFDHAQPELANLSPPAARAA